MSATFHANYYAIRRRNGDLLRLDREKFLGLRWEKKRSSYVRATEDGWGMKLMRADRAGRWFVEVRPPHGPGTIYQ